MIDIHTHIIPNVDDGSKSLEISRKLLMLEIENGVTEVICTPHQNKMSLKKDLLIERYNYLLENTKDLNIKISLGSEIYYYEGLSDDLKNNIHIFMKDSKYLLIEFSTRLETPIVDILRDLKIMGYNPIIAHIERYPYLTLDDYLELHRIGIKIQVNSLTFGDKKFKKNLKFLLKNDLIDFIGTDCHDLDKRSVNYEYAKKVLRKYPNTFDKLFNKDFNFNE